MPLKNNHRFLSKAQCFLIKSLVLSNKQSIRPPGLIKIYIEKEIKKKKSFGFSKTMLMPFLVLVTDCLFQFKAMIINWPLDTFKKQKL